MEDDVKSPGTLFHPAAALLIYRAEGGCSNPVYVEYMDIDDNGHPVNAHPLTVREAQGLAKALNTAKEKSKAFLKPKSMMPGNVLYLDPVGNGTVVWYTKPAKRELFFTEDLHIPCGMACVPAMVWRATLQKLEVYALCTRSKPKLHTPLYHAPFFNINSYGGVCMGTVDVNIKRSASLETFISAWENYFFNSYFSHLFHGHNPVKDNPVLLWKRLMETGEPFPDDILKKTGSQLKDIL